MGRPARRQWSDRELKDQAHALSLKGKHEEAAAVYRSLVSAHEGDSALRLLLAEACRKRGWLDDAVEAYQVAARLLHAAGHTARARAALTCALRIAPGEPVLIAAMRELSPPPALRLVPPPRPAEDFEELCEDAVTDPFCPLFD